MGDASAPKTLAEMCAILRVCNRTLRQVIKDKNVPVLLIGRRFLFDDIAEHALKEAIRRCPSVSSPAKAALISGSPAPSEKHAYEKALALLTQGSPKRRALPAKSKSTARRSMAQGR